VTQGFFLRTSALVALIVGLTTGSVRGDDHADALSELARAHADYTRARSSKAGAEPDAFLRGPSARLSELGSKSQRSANTEAGSAIYDQLGRLVKDDDAEPSGSAEALQDQPRAAQLDKAASTSITHERSPASETVLDGSQVPKEISFQGKPKKSRSR
jgi:hypothetical protein